MGLIMGLIVFLMSLVGAGVNQNAGPAFAAGMGIGMAIVLPIFYGVLGFIGGMIYAAIYNLIAAITGGSPLNEARRTAESTLTAIMARMSAYTGKELTWEQALNSDLDLSPSAYTWDAKPPQNPVAMPGFTQFV